MINKNAFIKIGNNRNLSSTIKIAVVFVFLSKSALAIENTSITNPTKSPMSSSESKVFTPKLLLMEKLNDISFFTSKFKQLTTDNDGNALQESEGELYVSKPNLLHWHTTMPDETQIISDGSTLWFFDPFIDQVSAYSFDSSIKNTPILLLTSNDESLWENYRVTQLSVNNFLVHSMTDDSQIQTLELIFNQAGLKQFNILDATGQLSSITLDSPDFSVSPPKEKFNFLVPEGVYIDDQR